MGGDGADDTARFMQAIAAFSAAPEPLSKHGRLIAADPRTLVQGILTEITETVLRRTLCFRSGQGDLLSLDVTERRILRVSEISDDLKSGCAVLNKDLTPQDASDVQQLLKLFAEKASEIYVVARLPDTPTRSTFTGVSIRDLSAAEGKRQMRSDLPKPLDDALDTFCAHASGFILDREGVELTRFGADEDGDKLAQLVAEHSAALNSPNRLRLWHASVATGKTVITARVGELSIWLLTSKQHMLNCFELLHGVALPDDSRNAKIP